MDELISKKELLGLTKISYGQLYRWKRMSIIPEDWFIKKSTPTGQETFFKKEKILERIEIILSMKDDASLDEIAALFNKKEAEKAVSLESILEKKAVSQGAKEVFNALYGEKKQLEKKELIILSLIEKYLLKSIITLDEIKMLMSMMEKAFEKLYNDESKLLLFRKFGISFVIGCKNTNEVLVDENSVKIIEVDMIKEVSEISRRLL